MKTSHKMDCGYIYNYGECCLCEGPHMGYMVKNSLWLRVSKKLKDEFICIACFEDELGKSLSINDLTYCPLNFPYFVGAELQRNAEENRGATRAQARIPKKMASKTRKLRKNKSTAGRLSGRKL